MIPLKPLLVMLILAFILGTLGGILLSNEVLFPCGRIECPVQ